MRREPFPVDAQMHCLFRAYECVRVHWPFFVDIYLKVLLFALISVFVHSFYYFLSLPLMWMRSMMDRPQLKHQFVHLLYYFPFACLHFVLSVFDVAATNTFHSVGRLQQHILFANWYFASFWPLCLSLCDAQSNDADDGGIGIDDICMN